MNAAAIPEDAVLVNEAYDAFRWSRWNGEPPPAADLLDSRWLDRLSDEQYRLVLLALHKVDDLDESAFVLALEHKDLPLLILDKGAVLQVDTSHLWDHVGHRRLLRTAVWQSSLDHAFGRYDGAAMFVRPAALASLIEADRKYRTGSPPTKAARLVASALRTFVATGGMTIEAAASYAMMVGAQPLGDAKPLEEWSPSSLAPTDPRAWERPAQSELPPAPDTPRALETSSHPGFKRALGPQSQVINDWFIKNFQSVTNAVVLEAKGTKSWDFLARRIGQDTDREITAEHLRVWRETMEARGELSGKPRKTTVNPG